MSKSVEHDHLQDPEQSMMQRYPALALRDVVVFPYMVIPLFVGRAVSVKAIEQAQAQKSNIFLLTQKEAEADNPEKKQLYKMGVIANILQLLKLPDGTVKVLVEGVCRAKLEDLHSDSTSFSADVTVLPQQQFGELSTELDVMMRSVKNTFADYVKQNKRIPLEILSPVDNINDPEKLTDTIAAHLPVPLAKKQAILEKTQVAERIQLIMQLIDEESAYVNLDQRLKGRVKRQIDKDQKRYYLEAQIKAIQNELGETAEAPNELEVFQQKIKESDMSDEAREKSMSELAKLKQMPPMSAESAVCRNYIECMLQLPWAKQSKVSKNLAKAEQVLADQHYGLDKVKERILEYIAVQQRVTKLKGPILCLVGPPGVGKTSLGRSIAEATGRQYARMSLGGVRDEAEIRGHRRTYVGSMPGKILQKLTKAEVNNPLFLLDEIDKMAMDFKGDPAAALLEVLDPEQNSTFSDHYLEVDYDLSDIMFVATANTLDIPPALADRMEIIRISGYTEDEKLNIALKHLLPKQIELNGLLENEIAIDGDTMLAIIRYYTREAGVRSLEREIAKICRKVVKQIVLAKSKTKIKTNPKSAQLSSNTTTITSEELEQYLGVKRYRYGVADEFDQIGQVTGLAWTEVGGELLQIEAAIVPGKGKTLYTGQLGDVMQESIHAALTVVRGRLPLFNVELAYFDKHDIHIHVPEGATPKDGPSAGVAMCTALVSVLLGTPVKSSVAMTGEITLRGEVLAIGGLKEKLLAAHRGNIRQVIIPEQNKKDLQEIPQKVLSELDIKPVKWIDEVFNVALVNFEQVLLDKQASSTQAKPKKAKRTPVPSKLTISSSTLRRIKSRTKLQRMQ